MTTTICAAPPAASAAMNRPVRADGDANVTEAEARDHGFDASRAFDEHGSELFGFAVNALRDRSLAEDCLQETFLRAWRARERFDGARASMRTWLFAIARNVIADALQARARMPRLHDDRVLDERAAPEDDPLERLRIVEAFAKLSAAHRDVLVAVHLNGMTYQDLSDRTGVPMTTLRSRAFYALRAVRAHLEGSEESVD